MKKDKKAMPTDVAKVIWEGYADCILAKFAGKIAKSMAGLHAGHPIVKNQTPILQEMVLYRHEFNRAATKKRAAKELSVKADVANQLEKLCAEFTGVNGTCFQWVEVSKIQKIISKLKGE